MTDYISIEEDKPFFDVEFQPNNDGTITIVEEDGET